MSRELQWVCAGHNPLTWVLGWQDGNEYFDAFAFAYRAVDGSWQWQVSKPYPMIGSAPSRLTAFDDCQEAVQRAYRDVEAAARK